MTRQFIRALWVFGGIVFLLLGVVGIALPLLPTTPFLLLAAYCFARGSDKLNNWLLSHPTFGPPVVDWRDHGAISAKAKRVALIVISATPPVTFIFGAPLWAIAVQVCILGCVVYFIWSRPLPPS